MVPAEQTADALAGQLIGGRYRVLRKIGKGGMGVVYEAEHVGLDKRVAVKFLLERFADDPEVIERFHREAKTASRIGQEHIIEVTDVGRADDRRPYLVMELLEGDDLAQVLTKTGPMPAPRAVHVVRQILRGLSAAHGKGIVHRDMKPENVFLVRRGDDPDFVKIMDFGISKVLAANESKVRLTATGAVIGTPIYMAPEQALANAELDHRVDLYAVGVMLFELLAGRPPFTATNYLGLVTQHLNAAPPSLAQFRPDLPGVLVAAVARALEKDPDKRFQSAAEMARALPPAAMLKDLDTAETLGDGVRVAATDGLAAASAARPFGTTPDPADGAPRRRRAYWIVGAAVALAIGMVAVAFATRGRDEKPRTEPEPVAEVAPPDAAPPKPAEVTSLGSLDIRAHPSGSRVFVDDIYKGQCPILVAGMPEGEHQLRLEKDGHQTLATTIFITGGKTTVVDDELPALNSGRPKSVIKKPEPVVKKPEPHVKQPEPEPVIKKPKTGRPGEKPNPYDD